jgi:transposase-like protein
VSERKSMTAVNSHQAMDLMRLIDQFGSEDKCREYLKHLRWPEGVECVKCGSRSVSWISTRRQFDCNSCRARFSVTAGTVFHDSHLPLRKWFLATYMMVESKKGISANQLRRTLAVSYKTAWYLCHRIRWAMTEVDPTPLGGTVEADETWIGGKRKGHGHQEGWRNKTIVLGAVERGGQVRLRVDRRGASSSTTHSVEAFLDSAVADDAIAIYTDQSRLYDGVGDENTRHESVDHGAMEWVRGDVSTNGIEGTWSLLKRSIVGSYHQLSAKHLPAYLDEFAFRFNNRENPWLFRDTLRKLIEADALTYDALITQQAAHP